MARPDRPAAGVRRRTVLSLPAVLLGAGTLAACSGSADLPDGWQRRKAGLLSVAVPAGWHEVSVPAGASVTGWDWVLQDTADFNDPATTVRLLAMTQGPQAVIVHPPSDAAEVAQALGAAGLFGEHDPYYPEATPVEDGEAEVQRVDVPYGDGAGHDHLLVAKDPSSGLMVVVGLTGTGVTEELLTSVAAGIQVVAPAG